MYSESQMSPALRTRAMRCTSTALILGTRDEFTGQTRSASCSCLGLVPSEGHSSPEGSAASLPSLSCEDSGGDGGDAAPWSHS